MRVGVLTGGGDCPGLNAVIRAIVRKAERHYRDEVIGFRDGWLGLLERDHLDLDVERMRGTLPRGGTILGSSRHHPFAVEGGPDRVLEVVAELGIDAVIVIGGEGTLTITHRMSELGLPVVGVPKTIDNDISGTELTFGFNTAVQIATDAIDRLHTTAESHDRVMILEVMGRHAGHIATWAGIAGGATAVLIPEEPFDIEKVCEGIRQRHDRGRYASIVVVAEGAQPAKGTIDLPEQEIDEFGHVRLGGIANILAAEIRERTGPTTAPAAPGLRAGTTHRPRDSVAASPRSGPASRTSCHSAGCSRACPGPARPDRGCAPLLQRPAGSAPRAVAVAAVWPDHGRARRRARPRRTGRVRSQAWR
jgi:6-phosphofructokinase 1